MAEHKLKTLAVGFVFVISTAVSFGHTIVVALDGSGDYVSIAEAAEVAIAGDSILVRDGDYFEGVISVDSAVVVFAEHHGEAHIWCAPYPDDIFLNGSAELIGFQILGDFMGIDQTLVFIRGGPAVIYNCLFWPLARFGDQLRIASQGNPPVIRRCSFSVYGGANFVARNLDSTRIWMPYNYYGTTDTTLIDPLVGPWIYVSPVLDTFEWLAVDEQPRPMPAYQPMELYPNPSYGSISIELPYLTRITRVDVFNILGQRVWTMFGAKSPQDNLFKFDLPLSSGNYFITVHERERLHTARLTIIR